MRIAVALLLVWRIAAGQGTLHPIAVVVIPTAIRDSMSAIWSDRNRDWDDGPKGGSLAQQLGSVRPTRAYLGCVTGDMTGDTVFVRHLVAAANVRQRQFTVTGDCSQVPEVVGTWHTHPYRAGFEGRAIKERALSGLDLKTFTAGSDLVAIVVWDADSLDLATRGTEGQLRHPATWIVR